MERWGTALISCVAMSVPAGLLISAQKESMIKADPYDEMIRNAYLAEMLKDHEERFDPKKPSYAFGDPLAGSRYHKQTWPR